MVAGAADFIYFFHQKMRNWKKKNKKEKRKIKKEKEPEWLHARTYLVCRRIRE